MDNRNFSEEVLLQKLGLPHGTVLFERLNTTVNTTDANSGHYATSIVLPTAQEIEIICVGGGGGLLGGQVDL